MTKKYKLSNGLSVVLNKMEHMKSVSMGIFVKSGSIYENKSSNGIAHFIEHMLFKGTKNRIAEKISEESDRLGGNLNAYTAEECTCIYIKVLSEEAEKALDLIMDIAANPVFSETAIENEKKVIIEEIASADDNPEDAAQEILMSNMFRDHPVGMPVLGSIENVKSFTKKNIEDFYNARFIPENIVISVSGNFNEHKVEKAIEESTLAKRKNISQSNDNQKEAKIFGGTYSCYRDIGQIQLVAGYPCVARHDERLYSFLLLAGILSGDSSSRLFRALREENGLVYNVDASVEEYENCGLFVVNTSFSAENTEKVFAIIKKEMNDILENGVNDRELERTKKNIITSIKLDSEGTMSTMSVWGKRMLYGLSNTDEGVIEKYMSVTNEDIKKAAEFAFSNKDNVAIAVIGDINSPEFIRAGV